MLLPHSWSLLVRRFIALVLACAFHSICGFERPGLAAAQPAGPERKIDRAEAMRKELRAADAELYPFIPSGLPPGRSAMVLEIPNPITPANVDRIKRILHLSEPQASVVDAIYAKYREDEAQRREKEINPLWERSASLGMQISGDPARHEEAMHIKIEAERAGRRLVELETRFFDEVAVFLADGQLPLLEQARQYRLRCRSMLRHAAIYRLRGANVDLAVWLDRCAGQEWFEVADSETFSAMRQAYEPTLTYLRQQHFRAYVKADIESERERMGRPESPAADDPAFALVDQARRASVARMRQLWKAPGTFERRLHELNNSYVELFAGTLGPETAAGLRTAYYERAYPLVYPNAFDAEPILQRLIDEATASHRDFDTLVAVLEDYVEKRNRLSRQMMSRSDDWFERLVRNRGHNQAEWEEFHRDMPNLETKRRTLGLEVLKTFRTLLGDQISEPSAAAIAEFESKAAEEAANPRPLEGRI